MDRVSKSFGGLAVFHDVSLRVEEGARLGILGPNGAGKSTIFNLLSGLQSPTAGTITYFGEPLSGFHPWAAPAKGIGRTFQIPQPFAAMTVRENLLVGLTNGLLVKRAEAEQRADAMVHQTGLAKYAERPAGELTLLNLKRLELARAAVLSPKLLLLDEVAGGLTEGECSELLAILTQITKPEMTVIWIEHVIFALAGFATEVAVLADKRIITRGGLDAVLNNAEVRSLYFGIEDEGKGPSSDAHV